MAAVTMDWGRTSSLRLRARVLAEGIYAGSHKSVRRGAGIEFGGFRPYFRGDDLRWLDRRSLLLHDKLVVRQFETETDRAIHLAIDASLSMSYKGTKSTQTKYDYAALLAAGLARVALSSGDPVGLSIMGGKDGASRVPPRSSGETFERIASLLESVVPEGDATTDPMLLEGPLSALAQTARRGSISIVWSDLVDAPASLADVVGALGARGRVALLVHVLDHDEVAFPFEGPLRLRALEGRGVVDTDQDAQARYLAAFSAWQSEWRERLTARGVRFVSVSTHEDPISALRRIVFAVR